MQYSQSVFKIHSNEDFVGDLWVAQLAELGYESFVSENNKLTAYILTSLYDEKALQEALKEFPYKGISLLDSELCEDKDWNEEWEKNYFQPIAVGDRLIIHSPFQQVDRKYEYDIIINPRMAFGTGHHQTTSMILTALLEMQLSGKSLLDMGCGTAVLAILAAKKGAKPITAVDIDTWCTDNAAENCQLNSVEGMNILTGDVRKIENMHFDVILANINRNILLMDMPAYIKCLNDGGELVISGFYTEDLPMLEDKAHQLGLKLEKVTEKDHWAMAIFKKINA